MSVLIGDLMPDTIVQAKAELPDIEKAMRIGKMPVADTVPRLFLCGQCRLRVIAEDQGICPSCRTMLEDAAVPGWGAVEWALVMLAALILAGVLIVIFGIVK